MKPEQWIIEDMRLLRQNKDRTHVEEQYLSLLLWYTKLIQSRS